MLNILFSNFGEIACGEDIQLLEYPILPSACLSVTQKVSRFSGWNIALEHYTVAWVTRPERPKGMKDVIKQARRAAT